MDLDWDLSKWHSSLIGGEMPKPSNLSSLAQEARTVTRQLIGLPRDPELWLRRAKLLKQVGLAELAIGDAYKAKLLIDLINGSSKSSKERDLALLSWGMRIWIEDQNDPKTASIWSSQQALEDRLKKSRQQLQLRMFALLADALFMATCFWDCITVAKEALWKFPKDQELKSIHSDARDMMNRKFMMERSPGMSEAQHRSLVRGGQVTVVPYPWMGSTQLRRDPKLMESLSASLKKKAPSCQLRLRKAPKASSIYDSYGIFATRNIDKGEVILKDLATVSTSTSAIACPVCAFPAVEPDLYKLSCCRTNYCSQDCAKREENMRHPAMCGKDLSHIKDASSSMTTDEWLGQEALAKIIASAIHKKISDPLSSGIVGHLQPHFITGYLPISLERSYVLPFKTLEALGVDIFADLTFDTWVLHQINCRFINNAYQVSFREAVCSTMNQYQTLFNHGCAPNCHKETAESDMSTLIYTAKTGIEKGDELCSSYYDDEYFFQASVEERQEILRPWFSEPCWCTKCWRERKLQRIT